MDNSGQEGRAFSYSVCLLFLSHTFLAQVNLLLHRVWKQMSFQRGEAFKYLAVYEFQSYTVSKDHLAAVLHLHLLSSCRMHQVEGPETRNRVVRIVQQ
jgi:hypothetical protein